MTIMMRLFAACGAALVAMGEGADPRRGARIGVLVKKTVS